MDSFHFRQPLQRRTLPTRLAARDPRGHFDVQDLDIFHLDFGGLAVPVTMLKCPRKRQSSPRQRTTKAKRAKSTSWPNPSGANTDEDAKPSGYQMLVASKSDAMSPQMVVEANVPYEPIGKSMCTSLSSRVSDDEGVGAPTQAPQPLLD
jgi:hypothetical protein